MGQKKTKEVTIKNGWYWSAGTQYWDCVSNSREGVGLNRELFDGSDTIIVKMKGKSGGTMTYELDTATGLEFIREHKSFKTIGTAKVGFVPRSLMREV